MFNTPISKIIVTLFSSCLWYSGLQAQSTIVRGKVTDARTKLPIAFVSIAISDGGIGTNTNDHGSFVLQSVKPFERLNASSVGYRTAVITVMRGKDQTINIQLVPDTKDLDEVVVKSGKKKKYTNKDNPAVELIRQVIAHKPQNQPQNYDYAEYRQYERMNFSLGDLSDKFRNKKMFKKYQFLFKEQEDSTAIGGKTLLPVYMEEKLSQNFYRKAPYVKKQVIQAQKQVKFDENFINSNSLSTYLNFICQDINIYDNNILVLTNQLLSPIAGGSPTFYKFFITDTLKDQSPQLIELSFTPRNTTDLLFEGKIYITMDGNFAVQGANLTVNKNINLNFVRRMQANLTFEKNQDGRFHLVGSDMKMDFGLSKNKGGGIFGERILKIDSFRVNQARPKETYTGPELETAANATERDEHYWAAQRPDSLPEAAAHVYHNMDSLQTIPSFKRTMNIATLALVGFRNLGPFEIGPVNTFYSFNPVEGFRMRVGGRTTTSFSRRYYFETYGAYGTLDQQFKYFGSATYSINNKSVYTFPQNYIRASFQHDTKIPGQDLQFVQENNFLLSFKRGENDQYLYNDIFKIDYIKEYENHFSYALGFRTWNQRPAGSLLFQNSVDGGQNNVSQLKTTEFSAEFRYAPKERYFQGKLFRTPITGNEPIFTLRYNQGVKGLLGGEYNYQNFTGNIFKRFYLSQVGYTNVTAEGGYIFGQLPFPLMDIHRANQTYSLQLQAYNLMNFQEFVSDHYASINVEHNFNGFLFNKVPLFKELKWREIISFKSLWGGVRDQNNPLYNPSLLRFPTNSQGVPLTYTLNNGPYMEGSVGVGNIFKLLRVDAIRRFNYLDNPNAPKWGVRALIKFDF